MYYSFLNINLFYVIVYLFTYGFYVDLANASLGDSFPSYKLCVKTCRDKACDRDGYNFKRDNSTFPKNLFDLRWRCSDDCQYECMWYVVDSFAAKGWPPPQFHGKWPFVRWLGLQEPASVIFSLMNLAVHLVMLHQFRSRVRPGGPMYKLWSFYFVVCANAWIWSAIFHSRDLPFTECMDYLSAFCMVFYSLYGMVMRMLIGAPFMISLLVTLVFLSFLLNHAAYLILDQLDYHYNMTANIVIGFISAACSAIWCILNWRRHSHSRNLALCLTWGILTTLLEISDFPPIVWTFDAHALWHLSTTPVPYFFWSFVIDDCKYLRKTYMKER